MCGAEVLVGTLTQPLRMAVFHKSALTEVRSRVKSSISSEVPLMSLHTLLILVRDSTILVFSKLVAVFWGPLCPHGFKILSFDILFLSHKMRKQVGEHI